MTAPRFEPAIETIYQCRVDYDVERGEYDDSYDKIKAKAHAIGRALGVDVVTTGGGPAWSAYVTITGAERGAVEHAARAFCAYVRRFRGSKLC